MQLSEGMIRGRGGCIGSWSGSGLGLGGASRFFQLGVTKIVCNPRVTNRCSHTSLACAKKIHEKI